VLEEAPSRSQPHGFRGTTSVSCPLAATRRGNGQQFIHKERETCYFVYYMCPARTGEDEHIYIIKDPAREGVDGVRWSESDMMRVDGAWKPAEAVRDPRGPI